MAELRRLPAEIMVFTGRFASQPLAFAHLLDTAPDLNLDHVEVVAPANARKRLSPYFEDAAVTRILDGAGPGESIVLILPAAFAGECCPLDATDHLAFLGALRGRVPHLVTGSSNP